VSDSLRDDLGIVAVLTAPASSSIMERACIFILFFIFFGISSHLKRNIGKMFRIKKDRILMTLLHDVHDDSVFDLLRGRHTHIYSHLCLGRLCLSLDFAIKPIKVHICWFLLSSFGDPG
jgi:hypothetical protein